MRAVRIREPGGLDVLEIVDAPRPEPGPDEILVRNFATALNRADILQRRGLYPPPPGEPSIPGLEFAGEVAHAGARVPRLRRGDRVFGLVGSGAYADFLTVDWRLALPIPESFSYDAAAAVPEGFSAAMEGLLTLAGLRAGETVLIHAGASGVGSAAVQFACSRGATVLATVGSARKVALCIRLGASSVANYREEDFAALVDAATDGRGVDVIFDLVGAKHWEGNLRSLAVGGRWVLLGLLGGSRVAADLDQVLSKRIRLFATTLRARSPTEKIDLARRFADTVLPLLRSGEIKPVIDSVFPLEEVRAAHARMEAGENAGKIVLRL